MSIIRSIKHRLGLSVTPANNFTFDASADNGTMKLARESGQDIMTVDAAGKVAFPQMLQSFVGSGYIHLPGGLILQWGYTAGGPEPLVVPFGIPFPTKWLNVQLTITIADPGAPVSVAVNNITPGSFQVVRLESGATGVPALLWFAIGY